MLTTALSRRPETPGCRRAVVRPVRVTVSVRRRRSVAVLAATLIAVGLAAAVTGSGTLWGVVGAIAVLAVVYAALLARVRHLATEREMSLAFGREATVGLFDDGAFDWAAFEREVAAEARGQSTTSPDVLPAAVEVGHADLARFLAAYALGWLLTPVVAALRLAGGDLSDLERHHVVERLVKAQQVGRSQSLRLLAAGVVATAGVTGVGALTAGVASASPAVSASATQTTYTVAAGDTLGSIAARFSTTVSALVAANGLSDANLIFAGQELTIPAAAASPAPSGGTYTVVAGDTLASIAARFDTTVSDLAALNGLADPNLIYVGEALTVPGAAATSSSGGSYTVVAGDTLASIAARFDTTVSDLAARNGLANPNRIYVGEALQVSGAAPAETATTTAATQPSSPGESAGAATAVEVALEQVGVPYAWGGASPSEGFDCSGLVMYAWAAAGVDLTHYTVSQYDETTRISEAELEPGDLVFYDTGSGAQPGHVTMYVGDGDVVSANVPGTDVQVQPLSYDGEIYGFGQVQ